ncbi:hypothetical protein FHW96_000692 [Novosphingobium sp. SG751A]|uniref:hypothetical protein n=1 Tax=Novosphingobium sp. SG751A TaxID=2587000 RepID=UPI0015566A7D|nr:hypothetical protein [Novosphingobium sp. SG751A]NOW44550.1 hypothetical protein [Novosphingobium sp. SG751A]
MNIATQAMGETKLRPLLGVGPEVAPGTGGPIWQTERVQPQGARRMALLVLGMHRSGTSALTRVFALLGAGLPATLLGGNPTNPTGHWESDAVRGFNDATLAAMGSDWFDWLAVNEGWSRSLAYRGYVERARAVLRAEFGEAPLFALKDPRICRLARFWLDVLEAEGVEAAIVMPLRNPLEVADSLARRDGVDAQIALLVWLRHVLEAEAATRGRARLVVSYDQVLNHWAQVADRAERELGVVWPRTPLGVGAEVEAFLSPDLRHHRRADGAVVDNPLVSGWVRRTYGVLLGWAEGGERAGDYGELDAVRAALDEAGPGFARPLRRIAQQQRGLEELNAQKAGLEARVEALNGELAQRGRERQEAVDGLAELARAYQAAQARLDEMALNEGRGGDERAAMAREIEHLRAQGPVQEQRAQEAQARVAMMEQEAGALRAALDEHRQRLGELEITLTSRQDEVEQTRIALEQERGHCAGLNEALEQERERIDRLTAELEIEQRCGLELAGELAETQALLQDQAEQLRIAMEQVAAMAEMLTVLRGDFADRGEELAAARATQAAWAAEAREAKAAALDRQQETAREIAELARLLQEAEGEAALWQGRWQEGEQNRAALVIRHAEAEQARGEQARRLEQRAAELEQARGRAVEQTQGLQAEKVRLEQQLSERFGELATMSGLLSTESERAMRSAAQIEWLREVHRVTARRPRWWLAMPRRWQSARMAQNLAEAGLFDEEAYLARYPDVAAQGHDPLRHYILFGMAEGRVRG